jgi:hypothetical protein
LQIYTVRTLHAVKSPLGFFKKTFRGFSQREEPYYRVGFVICVGEKTLNNPYL